MYQCGVTLLGIFTRGFSDRVDFFLPRQRTPSQPIIFGLVVPYVNLNITCALAYLESKTYLELFSGLEILCMYDQYALGRFGIISAPQALVC